MHSEWTDLLSGYLDGELDPVTRRRLERHLAECPECAAVRDDLTRIVEAAPDYAGVEPAPEVWGRIRDEIDAGRVVTLPRRPAGRFGLRHLIAAGLVMAMVGGGAGWYLVGGGRAPVAAPVGQPVAVLTSGPAPSAGYDAAIAELESTLRANRNRLDTATVRVLDESLATIDRAVAEARAAIQRDSANRYLNNQIAANLRKKVALLQLATRAIAAET